MRHRQFTWQPVTFASLTVPGERSPFLDELVCDGAVQVTGMTGEAVQERHCNVCDNGVFAERNERHAVFWSCSGHPIAMGSRWWAELSPVAARAVHTASSPCP